MRIVIGIAFASSLWTSNAFVPFSQNIQRSASLRLNARYQPPLPPPPPPPEKPDAFDSLLQKISSTGDVTTSGDDALPDFLDGLLRDVSSRLDEGIDFSLPPLPDKLPSLPSLDGLQDLKQQFQELDRSVVTAVDQMAQQVQESIKTDYPNLLPYLEKLQAFLKPALQSPSLTFVVSALLTYTFVSSLLNWDRGPPPSQPYPADKYDPIAARAYFDSNMHLVIRRGLDILVESLRFGFRVLQDHLK